MQFSYYYNGTRSSAFQVRVVDDYANTTVYSNIYTTVQARTLVSGIAEWNTVQMGLGARQKSMSLFFLCGYIILKIHKELDSSANPI